MSFPDPSGERDLVETAKRDPEAFGPLYDEYFDRIYAYIHRRVADRVTAEDLTAETFTKALANIGRYQFTGQPFAAWLYRIAANVVVDHYRSRRVHDPLAAARPQADSGGEAPEEAALRMETRERVAAAVGTLTPDQQEVVLLRFSLGFQLKEIAAVTGRSEGAVKALMFRALHALRGKLEGSEVRL